MKPSPLLIAKAIVCAFVFQHAFGQSDSRAKADEIYAHALDYEMSNIDSLRIFSGQIMDLSDQADYALGKVRAKIIGALYGMKRFKLDSAGAILNECEMMIDTYHQRQSEDFGYVCYFRGMIAMRKAAFEEAERQGIEAIRRFGDAHHMVGSCYSLLGNIEILRSNHVKALAFFTKAYQTKAGAGLRLRLLRLDIESIGRIYQSMGQHSKALDHFRKAYAISADGGPYITQVNNLVYLAEIKSVLGENDSAVYFFRKAQTVAEVNNDLAMLAIVDNATANHLTKIGRYNESNALAIPLLKKTFSRHSLMGAAIRIVASTNYLHLKNYDSALLLARQSYWLIKPFGDERLVQVTKLLSQIFEAKNLRDSSLVYLKIHTEMNDSLYGVENQRKLSTLYADLETLSKQKEIELLEKQREIEGQQKKNLVVGSVLGGIALIFIIISLILQFRNKKKAHQLEKLGLERDLDLRKKSLHEQALKMIYLNNWLGDVEKSLKKLTTDVPGSQHAVRELLSAIHINKSLDKEWDHFNDYFGTAHSGFFDHVNNIQANLTLSEKRLAGLIKMNMTNSEIASLLNIESNSVKTAKYRLKKKVGLSDEEDIHAFFHKL